MIVAALLALTGTGDASAQEANVYSSLPLTGPAAPDSRAIIKGAQLALREAGGTAGGIPVRYTSLNDAPRRFGAWAPDAEAANARRAARDAATVAYIGAYNSGASAVSMPILNQAGIVQISPTNTYIGLTRGGLGATPGEPQKYRPTGENHYVRLAPNDRAQGAALATAMAERRCRRAAVITDGELYGQGVGGSLVQAAPLNELRIVLRRIADPRARAYHRLALRVRHAQADCVAYAGITANGAVRLVRAIAAAVPRARFFAGDGVSDPAFTDPRLGGIPARVGRRVWVSLLAIPPSAHGPAGQDFFRRYGGTSPNPYAIHGYEAMRLVLDAIAAVGPGRDAVRRRITGVRDRPSVLGTYGFDVFGDTTRRDHGLYRVHRGRLAFDRRVVPR